MSNSSPARARSGVVNAAAAVWLIIGLVVLAGFASALIAFTRAASTTTTPTGPSPYQVAQTQRENDYWTAYQTQSDPYKYTGTFRTDKATAVSDGNNSCSWKARDPQGYATRQATFRDGDRLAAQLAEKYLC